MHHPVLRQLPARAKLLDLVLCRLCPEIAVAGSRLSILGYSAKFVGRLWKGRCLLDLRHVGEATLDLHARHAAATTQYRRHLLRTHLWAALPVSCGLRPPFVVSTVQGVVLLAI